MKLLFKVLLVVLLLVVVGVVVALFYVDSTVQRTVEREASAALGVETRVHSLSLHLLTATCAVGGVQIANPPNFESDHFLKLDQGAVSLTVGSLFKDTVEIPSLTFEGLDVYLERNNNGEKNYKVILDHSKKTASGSSTKKYIVRQIIVRNVTAHVNLISLTAKAGKMQEVHLKEIVLHDIGTDSNGSVELTSLMQSLVQEILVEIIKNGGNLLPSDLTKDITNLLPKGFGEATKGVGEKVKDTFKGVGDLFKK